VLLHDSQELGDDLGARSDKHLALTSLLGVVDGVERIVEDGCLDHFVGIGLLTEKRDSQIELNRTGDEVSVLRRSSYPVVRGVEGRKVSHQ
jgi:hypothetical protein